MGFLAFILFKIKPTCAKISRQDLFIFHHCFQWEYCSTKRQTLLAYYYAIFGMGEINFVLKTNVVQSAITGHLNLVIVLFIYCCSIPRLRFDNKFIYTGLQVISECFIIVSIVKHGIFYHLFWQ